MDYVIEWLRRVLLLPPQASTVARDIDLLHMAVITTTMLGAFAVTVSAIVLCVRFRRRGGAPRQHGGGNSKKGMRALELIAIGGLFMLFTGFWAVGFWQYIALAEPPEDTYDVYVSGKQWMWKFAYPDGSHTAGTLFVPAGRPVRLLLTSRDVIHSFYVPDFRVKQDAIPGRYTSVWFQTRAPGTHPVYCTEYCGTDHSRMRAEVVALSADDFKRWLERDGEGPVQPKTPAGPERPEPTLAERGEIVAAQLGCLRCHSLDGSPHIGPTWAGLYRAEVPLEGGGTTVADVAYLTESMMDPLAKLHRGFQPVMPSYAGYMKPADASALVELIKTLRDPRGAARPAPAVPPAARTVKELP